MSLPNRSLALVTSLASFALAACAVGPRYVRPELPERPAWAAAAPGTRAAGADEALLASWWSAFDDPLLASLVERAATSNLGLLQARARVREARARRGAAVAELAPSVTASTSASRSWPSEQSGGGGAADLFQAGLDASWELDLFGGKRRASEAAAASAEAALEDARDVRVSLVAEVGLSYLGLRTTEARLAVARRNLAALQETADLTRWRAEAGLTTQLDVEQARASLEQQRAAVPQLERTAASDRNALAVLLGLQPGALDAELAASRPVPAVSREVALGVPADALRRRPDVRRAERELAAQTAQVGVAQAARFPSLTLSGSIGLEALAAGDLVAGNAVTSSLGAGLLAPIFDAGRLARAVEVQAAVLDESLLAYRAAVLTALQEVEDALYAFDREQARRAALAEAEGAASQAAALARDQYQAGLVAFTAVLDAERTLLGVQDSLAASDGEVASDLVRLFKALGGGWTAGGTATQTADAREAP
ncbi:RND efflux system, outer membrane lipoprotein, NodT family [Anaeromyxobacter sp. K]|uniref:efflux transporter outer membrane subunit n=1 Tax=Anaeromyxobacter sp. (strain K) TaxID=447217 RepID=UPI00015F93AD|nr:efflux transporter outer membrane subunit [Anaeromyxobacter sp. K]ACG74817.1 RND efflux system, outer membrane lipoprotein, NodT family [Anaeromyxobacter sp. K]